MKYLLLLLIVSLGLLLPSCAKQGVQVPTALSSYNLSAYANDEQVTFNATAINHSDTILDIYGVWNTNINQTYILNLLHIPISKTHLTGTFLLNSVNEGQYYAYQAGTTPPPYTFYFTSTNSYAGTLKIFAFDTIKRSIAGTFSFTGFNSASNATISINNGQFSLKY